MKVKDYVSIMNVLDDPAFELCKSLLLDSKQLKFRYLKSEDIRRIDIAEKLYNQVVTEEHHTYKESDDFNEYAIKIKNILNSTVSCTEASRAERYKERAIDLCRSIYHNHDYSIKYFDDLTKIFICLMRKVRLGGKISSTETISDLDFTVSKNDIKLLNNIRTHEFKSVINKGLVKKTRSISEDDRNELYIFNVIFFCHILQTEGGFDQEETEAA